MEQRRVAEYIKSKKKYLFPNKKYSEAEVVMHLLNTNSEFETILQGLRYRKPAVATLISAAVGFLGIDRFMLGQYWLGMLKFFTFGGFYVLWVLDALTAAGRCRARNCELLLDAAFKNTHHEKEHTTYTEKKTEVRSENTEKVSFATRHGEQHKVVASADADVFLSYSHRDTEKVLPLFSALEKAGIRVWYDEGIRAGAEWEEEIVQNLSKAKGFLFFVTENSLSSQNCRDELYQARKRNKTFINIMVEDVDLSKPEFEWFDFRYSRYQQVPVYNMSTEMFIEKIKKGLN